MRTHMDMVTCALGNLGVCGVRSMVWSVGCSTTSGCANRAESARAMAAEGKGGKKDGDDEEEDAEPQPSAGAKGKGKAASAAPPAAPPFNAAAAKG